MNTKRRRYLLAAIALLLAVFLWSRKALKNEAPQTTPDEVTSEMDKQLNEELLNNAVTIPTHGREYKKGKVAMYKPKPPAVTKGKILSPAVKFKILAPRRIKRRDCIKVRVSLADVDGITTNRPVNTPVVIEATSGHIFRDASCLVEIFGTTVKNIPAKTPSSVVYFKAGEENVVELTASFPGGRDLPLASGNHTIKVLQ